MKIDSSAENSWLGSEFLNTGKCLAGHYEYIVMVSFSFMVLGVFVHMSLLNMLIYIDVLCVPITIHFNDLKYLSHLSWFNVSDSYLTCLA